ncbi:hypothetical protein Q5V23_000373 [Vibrio fluvialis]|nr:hypothetical protein [Vibrio fluvialis]
MTKALTDEQVRFVAMAPRGADILKTHKNLAAMQSGFSCTSNHELLKAELDKVRQHEQIWFHRTKDTAKLGREAQGEALKRLGSSKGAKVRHGRVTQAFMQRSRRLPPMQGSVRELSRAALREMANDSLGASQAHPMQSGWVLNPDAIGNRLEYVPQNRSRAYLMHQDWSGKYKMQVVYHPTPSEAPAANEGERYTEQLSARAVRKIFESGAYVAAAKGGFTTFLTLTFTAEQRNEIFSGNVTLGSEVSRFLDAAKKMYQRGFCYVTSEADQASRQRNITVCEEKIEVPGTDADFHYIWVAECPMNEDGEPNPHVHVLLNWQVERQHFAAWAKRIEDIWGHGIAHLERIKYSEAAAGYLIKAVGYAAKGSNADQGLIRGNRYNIARCSRAPAWDVLASFDVDNMTGIIKECAYRLERWRKPIIREIERKKEKKERAIAAAAMASNVRRKPRILSLVKQLETEITELKTALKSRGVFARSDSAFAITFEGEQAAEKMDKFLLWAAGARNWSLKCSDIQTDDLKQAAQLHYGEQYEQFLSRQADWRSLLSQELPPVPDEETINNIISWHKDIQNEQFEQAA